VLRAAGWAAMAASTLVIGALLGAVMNASARTVGLVMGFGAGALIAAVSFELTQEAFERGGTVPLATGLALGAVAFFVGDLVVDGMGGQHRKRMDRDHAGTPLALMLGATLDAVPESLIIGLSLIGGLPLQTAFLVSVAVSNLPEGFASAAGQRRQGQTAVQIVPRWLVIVAISAVSGAVGFVAFDHLEPRAVALTEAFGAGALLVMVMDTMAPEAFRDAGPATGLMGVAGFAFAFLLGTV